MSTTTRPDTETQDPSGVDGWAPRTPGDSGGPVEPRLRLLYHSHLVRIGSVSEPAALSPAEAWLTIGRSAPGFVGPGDASPRPLADPQVSREQLRVRWLPGVRRFEVEPLPSARRPLARVDLDPTAAAAAVTPITGATLLEPGACIAIGDRVLLGLELGRPHRAAADRMGLVGDSEEMWRLRDEIRSVAQFNRPALIVGPTGAGKELVARALHAHGPRAAGPFIPVNCAAIPEQLVESALFGHRKGAFTGADSDEKGLFRAADRGTLFLDELGELPAAVQPKFLRALQEGTVVPVGTHEARRVDVRVIAATHRDLEQKARDGGLREDLYHRLSAHIVRVPPLAERRFDVPSLVMHVLAHLRAEHPSLEWLWAAGLEWNPALPIAFVANLMARPLPGNVRQLQNLVERTVRLNLHPGTFQVPDATAVAATAVAVAEPGFPAARPSEPDSSDAEPAEPAEASPADLRAAAEALGLAHKTILKLLPAGALASLVAAGTLREAAAEALLALFEKHDFSPTEVATALGLSRTTLAKLGDDLGLPRAADLGPDEIARARAAAGGDLEAAARLLRVSPAALKKRVALLNLKARS